MTTTTAAYQERIKSPDWLAIKADVLTRANFRCELCGNRYGGLECHHLTYERLGHERMDDLIAVCRGCHRRLHGLE